MIETSDSSCILDYDFEKLLEKGATTLATLQQNGQVESIEAELDAKLVIETAVEKENPPMLNGNGSALDHNQQIEPKSCGFGISYLQQLGPSVLILGDGNLSFSLTLSRLYPRCRIIATVFEEQDEWMEKYGEIGKNILEKIKNEFPETKVQFEVDATRLKEWPFTKRTFSDIIFNFPHHGGKTNLKKSRAFLRNIFSSIADNLMSSRKRNHLHITLAPGQSGIDPEMVSNGQIFAANPPEHSLDSWQPLEIAAESGLIAVGVRKFDTTLLPGYSSSGYLSSNKAFHNAGDSHTIVFNWIGPLPKNVRLRLASAKYIESVGQRIRTAEPFDGVFQPIFNQFRPFHEYHLSIVFGKSHPCEDEEYMAKLTDNLFRLCHQFAAPFLVSIFELPEKRCLAPQRLPNRIYCLQYQGLAVPLYKELANCVHADVHLALRQELEESNTDIRVS